MNEERKIETEEVEAVQHPAARPRHARIRAQARLSRRLPRGRDRKKSRRAAPASDLQATVVEALKSIYDPEIPVDIYELGLIYDVDISEDGDATITMTLTTPHCPVAESLPQEVELRVLSVPGIRDAVVNLVWDPPWDPSKMSDEARLELGML